MLPHFLLVAAAYRMFSASRLARGCTRRYGAWTDERPPEEDATATQAVLARVPLAAAPAPED